MNERDTDELIEIAYSTNGDWQEEAILKSREVLKNRGVTVEMQMEVLAKWNKEYEAFLKEQQIEFAKNELVKYSILKMILIFFLSPFIFIGRIHIGYSYSSLKELHYYLLAKQRLILLISGACFYFLVYMKLRYWW